MQKYEIVYIVHPDLDNTALAEITEKVKEWITKAGGNVEKVDNWGKRRLAYRIRKQREGSYVLLLAEMPAEFVSELERNFQLQEPVMRYLVTRVD